MPASGPAALPSAYTADPLEKLSVAHPGLHADDRDEIRALWTKLGLGATGATASAAADNDLLYISSGQSRWGKPSLLSASITGASAADAYTLSLRNTHASGKAFRILDYAGAERVTYKREAGGNSCFIIANDASGSAPVASQFLCYTASPSTYVGADFTLDASGGSGADSGPVRFFAFQATGASLIRASEHQVSRYTAAGAAGTYILEAGLHNGKAGTNQYDVVGLRLYNSDGFGVSGGVPGTAGVYMDGGNGWWNYFVGASGMGGSGTTHFRVVGSSPQGTDVAGDVMSAGRIYSQQLGSTFRVGVIAHNSAPSGDTWAGLNYDTTTNGKSLLIGALLAGTAYHPVALAPFGGGVMVGFTPANLAAGIGGGSAGALPGTLAVNGVLMSENVYVTKKLGSLGTPNSGYSVLGVKTDEAWYRKTSAGAEAQLLDTLTTKVISQAQVTNTSNQAVATVTAASLAFTSETWDVGGWHDNSTNNNRLTAPVTGRYRVSAHAAFESNSTGYRWIALRKNGTVVKVVSTPAVNGEATYMEIKHTLDLAATDWVDCQVFQSSGGSININGSAPYTPTFDIVQQL